ncbi:N-acetylglucosamine-6-phosphate deacetylase [Sphingobacterium sp. LRF_L2]|uniref:N-acetylglucosamine-6-phosphate deacetylase n=1 Tax=Sphingobacterium sp. LRF_L2 TaxID=3369421 RepID=UPI003F62705F
MDTTKIVLVNGKIYNGDMYYTDYALLLNSGKIEGITVVSEVPVDYVLNDVQQANICPGLIDLQIYGTGTDVFSADRSVEALARIEKSLLFQGCTSFMLTLATNTLEIFKEAIAVFQEAAPRVALGLHLEGPFLNAKKRGAHPEELIISPSPDCINYLLAGDLGAVKMMTVAPEKIDQASLDLLLRKGILLSAGHSDASFQESLIGFEKGIQAVTHLWNAMSPFHHRDTGLPGGTFYQNNVFASIIADGIHVDFQALRTSKALLGNRLFLITDAVGSCDQEPYQHVFQGDHYTLPNGTLSGSALTMLQAIRNCVRQGGIPIDEAIRMATTYPAALIKRSDIGNLNEKSKANVLVFNEGFDVQSVYFEGVKCC